jgi:hypothetical protein
MSPIVNGSPWFLREGDLVKVLWLATVIMAALWQFPSLASGQHPYAPGVAFGAYIFPYVDGDQDTWGLQFDLFTELSKDLEGYPSTAPDADFEKYNDIDKTLGYTQLGHTWVRRKAWGPIGIHLRGSLSGGVVWDTPTAFLQNNVAHGIRNLTYVPRRLVRDSFVGGAGGDVTGSWGLALGANFDFIVTGGVGGALSTTYNDGYLQPGAEVGIRSGGLRRIGFGSLWRWGLVGTQFSAPEELPPGLDDGYWLWQGWTVIHTESVVPWFPRIRLAHMRSNGPFTETGGMTQKYEKLWSIRFETPAGRWAMEMWNDVGFKDLGPTFGFLVQWAP